MKPKNLPWLFLAALLFWQIPKEGKKLFPDIFGTAYIQWGSAIITALLISIGLFLSFYYFISDPQNKKTTGWTCLGFVTFFSFIVAYYGTITPLMLQMSNLTNDISDKNGVRTYMKHIYSEKGVEKRPRIAGFIYRQSGVAVPYQTENGFYVTYKPTPKDEQIWKETQETEAKLKYVQETLSWQAKQLSYLPSFYIGSFLVTFLVGIGVLAYKNKNETRKP